MKSYYRILLALIVAVFMFLSACERNNDLNSNGGINDSKPSIVVIGSEIEGIYLASTAMDEGGYTFGYSI
ncbi:hypothetical protein [Paenibacillus agricola]|uniref:Uncharacterized protein n=1 Tax=Paenibacillus agricola TaxID=2716264 RepID=A0ABX0JJ00_9BACL|nr:hypothetical protein [Paenibacillus agricola]NHN34723.1 hypothetical protein [Paenibacillus agricola]